MNASSSTISLLIPPSIPLILYGPVTATSIIDLFVAGVIRGVMLGIGLMSACWLSAALRNMPRSPAEGGWRIWRGDALKELPALFMPAFVIGLLVNRDLKLMMIVNAMIETAVMTGAVLLIIEASSVVQWILTHERVPQTLAQWIVGNLNAKWQVIVAMNVIMLLVGAVLDLPAAMPLLGPLFAGTGAAIGMDPVQLGLMMVINLAGCLYSPPVGTKLFISATIARTSIGSEVRELMPFCLVSLAVLILISYVPAFTIY